MWEGKTNTNARTRRLSLKFVRMRIDEQERGRVKDWREKAEQTGARVHAIIAHPHCRLTLDSPRTLSIGKLKKTYHVLGFYICALRQVCIIYSIIESLESRKARGMHVYTGV